jgi:hypothetical protein
MPQNIENGFGGTYDAPLPTGGSAGSVALAVGGDYRARQIYAGERGAVIAGIFVTCRTAANPLVRQSAGSFPLWIITLTQPVGSTPPTINTDTDVRALGGQVLYYQSHDPSDRTKIEPGEIFIEPGKYVLVVVGAARDAAGVLLNTLVDLTVVGRLLQGPASSAVLR